ncbi:HAMP domain-containing histidine kinase [Paenibacillus sp. N1-5-1-14]|uniref:sensor histidine kinase n=1 Tax=Paenibacillus radicibacter TaxID=2972488 RepID=UPI002158AD56|nr:HAMP domain-containing sensor histidine kinase [Paenibacillus radicibacter]MCR8645986.1 HAMP domain-containing histidine kinase [Paenibacillus radicibacter]
MNKIGKKLIVRILLALCIVFVLSFVVNTFFLPKYFLYEKKNSLAQLTTQLEQMDTTNLVFQAEKLEKRHGVTIVMTELWGSNEQINYVLKEQLNRKAITLSKFWVTDENLAQVRDGRLVKKIFSQDKLKSSFLVTFMKKDHYIIAVGESISHSADTIQIVNKFNLYIAIGAVVMMVVLSWLFTQQIVKPLAKLKQTAEDISNLKFNKVQIETGDEIEALARSVNKMSDKLELAQHALEERNENLRTFIADISHELKTPLSLIKAYGAGIRDGLDDGTYVNVIEEQADNMSILVDKLLELSRIQTEQYVMQAFDFGELLDKTLSKYQLALQQQGLEITVDRTDLKAPQVWACKPKIEMVLNNFITNAIKYTNDSHIRILVKNEADHLLFTIRNGIKPQNGDSKQWENIWEPFYVMEGSRNKKLSGTGLGLSIVRSILDKHQSRYGVNVEDDQIQFYFTLKNVK